MKQICFRDLKEAFWKYRSFLDEKLMTEEEELDMFVRFYYSVLEGLKNSTSRLRFAEEIAWDFTYGSDKYTFYDGIREELEMLSQKYCLLMLTDNWPCVLRIMKEKHLDGFFEKIYVSSMYGCKKEEGIFFDYPINEYSIYPENTIFVDDNERLLDVAVKKKLKVRLMDRKKEIINSKYEVIHSLRNL